MPLKIKVAIAMIATTVAGAAVWWILRCPCGGTNTFPEQSFTTIKGLPGPEDLVYDGQAGHRRLLVSSLDRTVDNAEGSIFQIDLAAEPPRVSPIDIDWRNHPPAHFRPNGLALVAAARRLFVINHRVENDPHSEESIEVFMVGEAPRDGLTFDERVVSKDLAHPNDLAVIPEDGGRYTLWVTNRGKTFRSLLAEMLIGPVESFVARFTHGQWTRVGGYRFANGIAADRTSLYVASTFDRAVFVHPLSDPNRSRRVIHVSALADNLSLESDGRLLVAGPSSTLCFLRYCRAQRGHDVNSPCSPTEVWRINPREPVRTDLLFEDDGSHISAGSTAVCVGDDLFVGQPFRDYVLRVRSACQRKETD